MTSVTKHISIVTVTAAGRPSDPLTASVTITDGDIVTVRPPSIYSISAEAAAAGKILVRAIVIVPSDISEAITLEIAERNYRQAIDFSSPVVSKTLGRHFWAGEILIDGSWTDGQNVYLAARCVAGGHGGDIALLGPVVSRSAATTENPDILEAVVL